MQPVMSELRTAMLGAMIVALGWLGVTASELDPLRTAFEEETDPLVRILLARELLLAEAGSSPPDARRLVRDEIMRADEALSAACDEWLLGIDLVEDLALALAVADPVLGSHVLPRRRRRQWRGGSQQTSVQSLSFGLHGLPYAGHGRL